MESTYDGGRPSLDPFGAAGTERLPGIFVPGPQPGRAGRPPGSANLIMDSVRVGRPAEHVSLLFAHGATLPDPKHLLEGDGKGARRLKITTPADIENAAVQALLKSAAAAGM
jgi:hypothetical protein